MKIDTYFDIIVHQSILRYFRYFKYNLPTLDGDMKFAPHAE